MVYIFCATYVEAKAYIDRFNLKKNTIINKYQVFSNERLVVAITGIGSVEAAICVTMTGIAFNIQKDDIIVNIGVAAATEDTSKGDIFLCNKIVDTFSNREYYPDMVYNLGLRESMVFTHGDLVKRDYINSLKKDMPMLFDMEAAGIYMAARKFVNLHNIIIIKVVSDYGMDEKPDYTIPESVVNGLDELTKPDGVIDILLNISESSKDKHEYDAIYIRLCEDLKCSSEMEKQLKQYLRVAELMKIDYNDVIDDMYNREELPVSCRKDGKELLKRIKSFII